MATVPPASSCPSAQRLEVRFECVLASSGSPSTSACAPCFWRVRAWVRRPSLFERARSPLRASARLGAKAFSLRASALPASSVCASSFGQVRVRIRPPSYSERVPVLLRPRTLRVTSASAHRPRPHVLHALGSSEPSRAILLLGPAATGVVSARRRRGASVHAR